VDQETVHELAEAARDAVPRTAFDYLIGGSESETTLARNRAGYDRLALIHRVLRNVEKIDLSTTFLGHKLRIPVMLAPMGALQSLHPDGALAQAQGAERFGTISILSAMTRPVLEEIAAATKHPKIYQLNVRGDADWVDGQVQRAIDHGYVAFCVIVDIAMFGRRERDILKRYRAPVPPPIGPQSMMYAAAVNWHDIDRIKRKFKIPLIVKGIGTGEDAALCVEHGVDVVYISNHGGRQLDHGRGTVDVLPEVVEAVAGRARVVIDGGIMRGTDVLKALCLGADAVGIGKVCGLALAAGGADGVLKLLEILETEMRIAMAQLRCTSIDQLGPEFVRPAVPNTTPHVLSHFPHLKLDLGSY
jgi:glycolate oxidase